MTIGVLGSTGCVGGHLLQALLNRTEHQIVAAYRSQPEQIQNPRLRWQPTNLNDPDSLNDFLRKVDLLYYLVHSLEKSGFRQIDKQLATNVASQAARYPIRKIIYLGGLYSSNPKKLSTHLASRQETGLALAACGLPVVELRASIVLAQCSDSFRIIHSLAKNLPFLIAPPTIHSLCSPVTIHDLTQALINVIDLPTTGHEILEIGSNTPKYSELLQTTAQTLSHKKLPIFTLPLFPSITASIIASWLSKVPAREIHTLFASLKSDSTYQHNRLPQLIKRQPQTLPEFLTSLDKN
jgi:uncharacterized protein YbjT (DUF2867 family)